MVFTASCTIEIVCGEFFFAENDKLQTVEAKILTKRAERSKFEAEYREIYAPFYFIYFLSDSFFAWIVCKGYIFKQHDLQVLKKSSKYTQEMQMVRVFLILSSFNEKKKLEERE
jgi:hypothetical protein